MGRHPEDGVMSVVAPFCGPAVVIGAAVAFITWSARALPREVRSGSDGDFLALITPTAKPGMPSNRTASGRRLKVTHADAPCKQRRRTCPMDHSESQKTRVEPHEIKGN